MSKLVVDLTDVERTEFEVLRSYFPIMDGQPIPSVGSVLATLAVNAQLLSAVLEDPGKKSKLGMEGLAAPRRHQRKIVAACHSLERKLNRYSPSQFALLMNLVGLSNRLVEELGEDGAATVFSSLNTPVAIEPTMLLPYRPADPASTVMADAVERLLHELQVEAGRRDVHGPK